MQPHWHLVREQAIPLYPIHTETLQHSVGVEETETVAIGKRGQTCHRQGVAAQLLDRTHKRANGLWGVERGYARLTAVQEIGGEATIESFVKVWGERVATSPQGGPPV